MYNTVSYTTVRDQLGTVNLRYCTVLYIYENSCCKWAVLSFFRSRAVEDGIQVQALCLMFQIQNLSLIVVPGMSLSLWLWLWLWLFLCLCL